MTRTIEFTKMHGLGNDFILVESAEGPPADVAELARRMADRHGGVGADGLIFVTPPPGSDADVGMRMFNADGSESQMCGNGIRCLCKLVRDRGLSDRRPLRVATGAGVLVLEDEVDGGGVTQVTVDMGPATSDPVSMPLDLPGIDRAVDLPFERIPGWDAIAREPWARECGLDARLTCVATGNPHAVIFCRDVEAVPLATIGPRLERDPVFPHRTNVHFARVLGPAELAMRTWERGSGATLACGTGASAVAVAAALTGRAGDAVLVHLPGGDLRIRWDRAVGNVFMTGPAVEVFSGRWVEDA